MFFGLAFPLGVFALGRAAYDARTGAWAAVTVACGHQLLGRNAHVLGARDPEVFARAHHLRVVRELATGDNRARVRALRGPAD